ncbi:hypothetical protein D6764_01795 [Candidatus Woesearchaeota archaeon]|nr:MAG: hypothetical protein D6764_01795 [Candidatus Woesearchaeota archaeon]
MSGYTPNISYDSGYHPSIVYSHYGVSERADAPVPEAVREAIEGRNPSGTYQTQLSQEALSRARRDSKSMVAEMMPGPHPLYYLPDHVFYEHLNMN